LHRFSGRIGKKKLKPGAYRVTLMASDAAKNHSVPRRFEIKVARR